MTTITLSHEQLDSLCKEVITENERLKKISQETRSAYIDIVDENEKIKQEWGALKSKRRQLIDKYNTDIGILKLYIKELETRVIRSEHIITLVRKMRDNPAAGYETPLFIALKGIDEVGDE